MKPMIPIPPLSVVRLVRADRKTPEWRKQIGRIFRVGYYAPKDGLDCVWLVNDDGKYEQTTDHADLYGHFDVISFGKPKNWFGDLQPRIARVLRAGTQSPGGGSRR